MFCEKSLSKCQKISKRGEMENFVISAQIWDLNQVFLKSLTFFSQKTIGVAGDYEKITQIERLKIFDEWKMLACPVCPDGFSDFWVLFWKHPTNELWVISN